MEALEVRDLQLELAGRPILREVSLQVVAGGCTGLVGESGSGKSMTALAALGLLPRQAAVTGGSIVFNGQEILGPTRDDTRRIRGSGIAMIFQSPRSALNPVMRVGAQVKRVLRLKGADRTRARSRVVELLAEVGLPEPQQVANLFPHQLSGGMCQRIMIAMGLASHPRVLIADEPTTALDVTVQAEILDLLETLTRETGMGTLLISHDLSVVAERCQTIAVMQGGAVVESGSTQMVISAPQHPFTRELVRDLGDGGPDTPEEAKLVGTTRDSTDRGTAG